MSPSRLQRVDVWVGDIVRRRVAHLPAADALTRHTTDLGSMFMVVGSAGTLAAGRHRRQAVEVMVAGTLGWSVAQEVKKAFDRPRPYQSEGVRRLIPEPIGSSMPSGHAAVVSSVATVMATHAAGSRRWPWVVIAGWVPITRIFLGVHYPSDTVVGLTMGHLLGRAVTMTVRRVLNPRLRT